MEVFIGTIMGFGFNFAPRNWAFCAGQTIAVQQNTTLFSLLGTTYGGNGTTNFLLPNMVGRTPIGFGNGGTGGTASWAIGQVGGTETTTLLVQNMPAHNHAINVSNNANATTNKPDATAYLGQADGSDPSTGNAVTVNIYTPAVPNAQLNPTSMSIVGGSQPFNNLQPYLAVNYCIALYGIYPSRN